MKDLLRYAIIVYSDNELKLTIGSLHLQPWLSLGSVSLGLPIILFFISPAYLLHTGSFFLLILFWGHIIVVLSLQVNIFWRSWRKETRRNKLKKMTLKWICKELWNIKCVQDVTTGFTMRCQYLTYAQV